MNDNANFYRKFLTVVIPLALQSLISASLNFVDNLMVGNLGETQLAAVGVGIQMYYFYWVAIFGITSGCSTFFAQFWGTRDLKSIRKTIGIAFTACLILGFIFLFFAVFAPEKVLGVFTDIPEIKENGIVYVKTAALCFLFLPISIPLGWALRATQQTKIPLYISTVSFVSNTLLNYVLIFGKFGFPPMGIRGAAIATTIARGIEALLTIYVIFGRKNIIAGPIKEFFEFDMELFKRVVKNAIPTTVNESMWAMGNIAYTSIYARIGVTAYAALQAGTTINQLFTLAIYSIGDAVVILVGEKLGENKFDEAIDVANRIVKITVIVGFISGVVLILMSPVFVSMFNFTETGAMLTRRILIVFGVFMITNTFSGLCLTGVFRCGGDTKFAMILETSTVWLIGVPVAAITALILKE